MSQLYNTLLDAFDELSDIYDNKEMKDLVKKFKADKNMNEAIKTEAGPYWYFTLHGVGPGSVPSDIEILEVRDGVNEKGSYGTFFLSDKVITTDDLKFYDLIELSPECEECETFSGDDKIFDIDNSLEYNIDENYGKELANKLLNERYVSYDPAEWDDEEIELHKEIDWKKRNYLDYDTGKSINRPIVLYGSDRPQRKDVEMHLFLRSNPIYPPYYKAIDKHPFDTDIQYVGPMYDGHKEGIYDIHDRYETYETYDAMFDSLENTSTKTKLNEYYDDIPFDSEDTYDEQALALEDGPGKYGFFASPAHGYPTELMDVCDAEDFEDAWNQFSVKYDIRYGNVYKLDAVDPEELPPHLREDLAPQFKKDIKRDWKNYQHRLDRLNSEIDDVKDLARNTPAEKRVEVKQFMQDWINRKKAELPKFKYEFPRNVEKDAYPFYVTVYQEYPIYEPAEGGYYYAGADAMMSKGYNSKEEAKAGLEELANEFKEDGYDLYPTYSGYATKEKYIGDNTIISLETAKNYLSQIKGWEPYQ